MTPHKLLKRVVDENIHKKETVHLDGDVLVIQCKIDGVNTKFVYSFVTQKLTALELRNNNLKVINDDGVENIYKNVGFENKIFDPELDEGPF